MRKIIAVLFILCFCAFAAPARAADAAADPVPDYYVLCDCNSEMSPFMMSKTNYKSGMGSLTVTLPSSSTYVSFWVTAAPRNVRIDPADCALSFWLYLSIPAADLTPTNSKLLVRSASTSTQVLWQGADFTGKITQQGWNYVVLDFVDGEYYSSLNYGSVDTMQFDLYRSVMNAPLNVCVDDIRIVDKNSAGYGQPPVYGGSGRGSATGGLNLNNDFVFEQDGVHAKNDPAFTKNSYSETAAYPVKTFWAEIAAGSAAFIALAAAGALFTVHTLRRRKKGQ